MKKKGIWAKSHKEMVFLGFSHITALNRSQFYCSAPMILKLTG